MIYNLLLNEKEKEREREKNRKCHLSREPMYLSLGIHFSRFSHSTKFRHSSSVCVKDPPPSPLKFQPSLASGLKSLAYKFRINETPGGLSPFDIFIYIHSFSPHCKKISIQVPPGWNLSPIRKNFFNTVRHLHLASILSLLSLFSFSRELSNLFLSSPL